ncbi:thermospermine synthase ACAULIS5-like isoform X1 [Hevea brasiliensis]|uniref:thermospermine synthase ACAULIS5-like isoform X1 n=1 Tax=Hevea brasiliensis TaxID=3981 RepID=UPI0025FA76D7|nr:thermospermine synthase ACAULIS5-like isoform X1 [Hevea brasiliensis]
MGSIMNFPIRRIPHFHESEYQSPQWFEELIEPDLKWSFEINSVLHAGTSEYQNIVLLDTNRFGKALVIDGKMQSAGKDEFIYHECLVHPVLIFCESPKSVFIMGGGEGSTAREVLKHNGVEKVVKCDIDRVVVDFCRMHLTANQEAFSDGRLHCIINDANNEKFDIIFGDLADPLDGGP